MKIHQSTIIGTMACLLAVTVAGCGESSLVSRASSSGPEPTEQSVVVTAAPQTTSSTIATPTTTTTPPAPPTTTTAPPAKPTTTTTTKVPVKSVKCDDIGFRANSDFDVVSNFMATKVSCADATAVVRQIHDNKQTLPTSSGGFDCVVTSSTPVGPSTSTDSVLCKSATASFTFDWR